MCQSNTSYSDLLVDLAHSGVSMHHHSVHSYGWAFIWAVVLNGGYVALELFFCQQTQSHSLLADAIHNVGDISGLLLAWLGYVLMAQQGRARYTYGYKKLSIIASLLNGLLLLLSALYIAYEAYQHFLRPESVDSLTVLWIALIGIVVNGGTAMFFMHHHHDLNIKGAFLHLMADALVSLGVLLGAGLQILTGWSVVDPVIGLSIALVIVWSTWGLLREAMALLMAAVPEHIEKSQVQEYLQALPGVCSVHDLHIWGLSTQEVALTAHLVMPNAVRTDEVLCQIKEALQQHFAIRHVTLQIERGNAADLCDQINHC